ncbi:MAG: peptide chain release factor 2 [Candidatus Pacebacteria bacterium]|nr:peptide chain release factor 2 [Candidatus Paceibacterota bacterium]
MSNSASDLIKQTQSLLTDLQTEQKKKQLAELEAESAQPGFWNKEEAKDVMQEISWLREKLEQVAALKTLTADLETYHQLADEATNSNEQKKIDQEIKQTTKKLRQLVSQLELEKYLSGKYDKNHAILSIHPGQGGTEAQDWAEMLERMYSRYFERKDWSFSFLSETRGEEAGIKEASFEIKAPFAYGYLKGERGTHRLVRLSPFNADNLRQTSFALVEVLPVIKDDKQIELKEEDLEWNFTRAGGPGGQSVNKTNSAVELTHQPTGTVVKCRESRSQVENKTQALKILKAKLAAKQEEQIQQALEKEKGGPQMASWGTQIRNYVLHPYQLVKDTRTKVETSDSEGVLDGDLEQFIQAEIKLTQ